MTKILPDSNMCISVAVFAPLRTTFSYLPPESDVSERPFIGQRVWVPFGRGFRVGVVTSTNCEAKPYIKMKKIAELLDTQSLLTAEIIELAEWASKYYHHPIGETLSHAFPASLRKRKKIQAPVNIDWTITGLGRKALESGKLKGKRQIELMSQLASFSSMNANDFKALNWDFSWRSVMKNLMQKNFILQRKSHSHSRVAFHNPNVGKRVNLNSEQAEALEKIQKQFNGYGVKVLYGVTGSGKTEVYMELIARLLSEGKQSLVLVPEVTLTEQIVQRFKARFHDSVGVLHSQCKDSEKLDVWNGCRNGTLSVLIGTRSAIWVPMKSLGVIVVDEEHDVSYKQQEGLAYSGRDLAIKRAQIENIPVILGSATPSLETIANISSGRFEEIPINRRAKTLSEPVRELVDISKDRRDGGLGKKLIEAIEHHVSAGGQVILFLNRRGYAPLMMCRNCGTHQICRSCERHLVYHKRFNALVCHHCGKKMSVEKATNCCKSPNLFEVGIGTEQVEEKVSLLFPKLRVGRVDRDSVKNPKDLQELFRKIANREVDILIGTQMVAKGLDFSGITLVGIIDTDSRLFSVDYKSEERLAQLLTQVAGRCGRGSGQGKVLIQSRQPDNFVLNKIIHDGYRSYSSVALKERERLGMPPFSALALIKADSSIKTGADKFLICLREKLMKNSNADQVFVSYPISAFFSPKRVKYRSLMVMQCQRKVLLQGLLSEHISWIEALGRKMRVRWLLDVDPEDTL